MGRILVSMPKIEDAKRICEMLLSRGIETAEICLTGDDVLMQAHQYDSGVVICTRSLRNMYCSQLKDSLPDFFEMVLLTSKEGLSQCPPGVTTIEMPFRPSQLVSVVESITTRINRRIRNEQVKPKKRDGISQEYIDRAKRILMERNNMTEPEAFRYIQKCSMDSGTNMAETAQMILMLQKD